MEILYIWLLMFFVFLLANHLTDKDAKAFAEALKENRTLEYLDISHNEIGELGGIYLGAGLVSNYVNSLSIRPSRGWEGDWEEPRA